MKIPRASSRKLLIAFESDLYAEMTKFCIQAPCARLCKRIGERYSS